MWHETCPEFRRAETSPTRMHPTLRAERVVLWHLYRPPDQEVWCVVMQVGHLFTLRVCRDTDPHARPMSERYADFAAVARRAADVKQEFVAMGWREPELHQHGSGA